MINKPDHKPDRDDRDNHANDNGENKRADQAIASAPAGGALASLAALGAALNSVDTASVTGRSGMPMLQFKSRENGTWMFGQKRTLPEDGSRWGLNPMTFQWGFVCFSNDNSKLLGERMVPVTQPKPEVAKLPDKGSPWQEQWTVNLKCINGADAGAEVVFRSTTDGGIKAIGGLIDAVRDRLNSNQHDGKVSPIVHLERDSYPHREHGRIWFPVLTIVDWMPLSGPAPTPEPAPPVAQPRRRRVG